MATIAQARDQTVAVGRTGGKRRFRLAPYLFILPHLIFFVVFVGWPLSSGWASASSSTTTCARSARNSWASKITCNLFTPGSVEFQLFWNALINTVHLRAIQRAAPGGDPAAAGGAAQH